MPLLPNHDSFVGQFLLNVLDKLVIGLLAAIIVFSLQSSAQKAEDERQRRIAAAQLESTFVADALSSVTNSMNAYYKIAKGLVDDARPPTSSDKKELANGLISVERALDILVVLVDSLIVNSNTSCSFKALSANMYNLNKILEKKQYKHYQKDASDALKKVEENYRAVVQVLRDAALNAIRYEGDVADDESCSLTAIWSWE